MNSLSKPFVALIATALLAASSAPGAVILGDDFDNVGDAEKTGNTASFGSWDTVNGVDAPAASLSFTDPGNGDAALSFFETQDGELDVNENIGSGGQWETSFVLDLDALTTAIDLTTLDLTVHLLNSSGADQANANSKDGIYTVEIIGSSSGSLGTASTTLDYTTVDDQPVSVDLSSYAALTQSETYTVSLTLERDDGNFGHNVSLKDLTLNGTITAIPEPASLVLAGLGSLLMLGRGRRRQA